MTEHDLVREGTRQAAYREAVQLRYILALSVLLLASPAIAQQNRCERVKDFANPIWEHTDEGINAAVEYVAKKAKLQGRLYPVVCEYYNTAEGPQLNLVRSENPRTGAVVALTLVVPSSFRLFSTEGRIGTFAHEIGHVNSKVPSARPTRDELLAIELDADAAGAKLVGSKAVITGLEESVEFHVPMFPPAQRDAAMWMLGYRIPALQKLLIPQNR